MNPISPDDVEDLFSQSDPTQRPTIAHSPHHQAIVKELARMSALRKADESGETFVVFADELLEYNIEDVKAACTSIGKATRPHGEKAFPEFGFIEEEVKRQRSMRRSEVAPTRRCKNPLCKKGMVVEFNRQGMSTGVSKCRTCGGPAWFDDAKRDNEKLMRENGIV